MKLRPTTFLLLVGVLVCVFSGCASVTDGGVKNQAAPAQVYADDQLTMNQYELVSRLWEGTWRSAFWLPTASSQAEGIASLQAEASRLGANGLINVICTDQGESMWSRGQEGSILCNGDAIRVR